MSDQPETPVSPDPTADATRIALVDRMTTTMLTSLEIAYPVDIADANLVLSAIFTLVAKTILSCLDLDGDVDALRHAIAQLYAMLPPPAQVH